MSWKNLASVAVCALLAAPALAAPVLDIRNTGLDASGNWLWELRVTPDASFFVDRPDIGGIGGSMAIELGLETDATNSILGITANPASIPDTHTGSLAAPVEFENPGNVIEGYDWLVLEDVSEAQDGSNMKPVGIQFDGNEAFVALGTTFFRDTDVIPTNGHLIATIATSGPTTTNLTSSLSVLGSYDGNGALAQSTGELTAELFDGYTGAASRTVLEGDANLSGATDLDDLILLSANFNDAGTFRWQDADFNGSTTVDLDDLIILSSRFNQSGGVSTPLNTSGGGAGAGVAAIPEPTSIALAGLAMLVGLGFVRRK